MFSFIKTWFQPTENANMYVNVKPVGHQYGLFDREDNLIQAYSRKRDAIRGATRRGFTLN